MYDRGHRHGVRKKIVEGLGGAILGAAGVLLLARFTRGNKAEALPAASPPGDESATAARQAVPGAAPVAAQSDPNTL